MTETIFYTHGAKTRGLVVCFHGFTSSPYMFRELAATLHSQGFDVFCPPTPCHGTMDVKDILDFSLDQLGPWFESFANLVSRYEHLVALGSSFGALIALYFSKLYRVKKVLLFVLPLRLRLSWPFSKALALLSRVFGKTLVFWDKNRGFAGFPAKHGHAQYPLGVLDHIERLKRLVRRGDLGQETHLMYNRADKIVSLSSIGLFKRWFRAQSGAIEVEIFDKDLLIPHDMLDQSHHRHKNGFAIQRVVEILT